MRAASISRDCDGYRACFPRPEKGYEVIRTRANIEYTHEGEAMLLDGCLMSRP